MLWKEPEDGLSSWWRIAGFVMIGGRRISMQPEEQQKALVAALGRATSAPRPYYAVIKALVWLPDEVVEEVVFGRYQELAGVAVATNTRVIFAAVNSAGLLSEAFEYPAITAVTSGPPADASGRLEVEAGESRALLDEIAKPPATGAYDEPTTNIVKIIRQKIEPYRMYHFYRQNPAQAAAELQLLSLLRDQGTLTEAEFLERKKLLGL